jgi:hypothetical protein
MVYPNDYTPIHQYNGYVSVPHATYDEFRNATLGNGYNVDGMYGNQCWDYVALLYWQYGLTLVTKAGGGTASDCWNISKNANSQPPFIAVEGVQNIKRGDVIVTGANQYSSTGHICIADEDWNYPPDNKIWCVGQNQGHGSLAPVTRDRVGMTWFLGIFRNTEWQSTPTPTPPEPVVYNKNRYNFVLFNRRKRQEKWIRKPLKRR